MNEFSKPIGPRPKVKTLGIFSRTQAHLRFEKGEIRK